jgi:hypothetical protein
MKQNPMLCLFALTMVNCQILALPVAPGLDVSVYADVTDPVELAFSPDGILYTGRDNLGSGGSATGAAFVHRIGPGGSPVIEYGATALVVGGFGGAGIGGYVSAILPDESIAPIISGDPNLGNPSVMTSDTAGRLLFTDVGSDNLIAYDGSVTVLVSLPVNPNGILVNYMNEILVRTLSGAVMQFSSDGSLIDANYLTGLSEESANTLAIGPGGFWGHDLYLYSNGHVLRYDANRHSTIISSGFDTWPRDMAFGPDGAMYLSMFEEDRIIRITPEPTTLLMVVLVGMAILCRKKENRR